MKASGQRGKKKKRDLTCVFPLAKSCAIGHHKDTRQPKRGKGAVYLKTRALSQMKERAHPVRNVTNFNFKRDSQITLFTKRRDRGKGFRKGTKRKKGPRCLRKKTERTTSLDMAQRPEFDSHRRKTGDSIFTRRDVKERLPQGEKEKKGARAESLESPPPSRDYFSPGAVGGGGDVRTYISKTKSRPGSPVVVVRGCRKEGTTLYC